MVGVHVRLTRKHKCYWRRTIDPCSRALFSSTNEQANKTPKPQFLVIPEFDLQINPSVFALLNWRVGVAEFAGRDTEIDELLEWANARPRISIKLMTGPGGAGKSRLAAHIAKLLRAEGWEAGFMKREQDWGYWVSRKGMFGIVDYAEESADALKSLMLCLSQLDLNTIKVRILLLSRQALTDWLPFFKHADAMTMLDSRPVTLGAIEPDAAYSIFNSAQETASEALGTIPLPVSNDAFSSWLGRAPEHARPLFIVAAAVQSAAHPMSSDFDLRVPEILHALIDRERRRLRSSQPRYRRVDRPKQGRRNLDLASYLCGTIKLAYGLTLARSGSAERPHEANKAVDALRQAAYLEGEYVISPQPDLLAACFASVIIDEHPTAGKEWVWRSFEAGTWETLDRFARICHDSLSVSPDHRCSLAVHAAQAVLEQPIRAIPLRAYFLRPQTPWVLQELDIAVWQALADHAANPIECSFFLNNHAFCLIQGGEYAAAIDALEHSIQLKEPLRELDPDLYDVEIAINYYNIGRAYIESSELGKAHVALRKAIRLFEKSTLSSGSMESYCGALSALSKVFLKQGRKGKALRVARQSAELAASAARHSPAFFFRSIAIASSTL